MFAAFAFLGAGFLSWLHFTYVGRIIVGPVTVWHVWIFATMVGCAIDVLKTDDRGLHLAFAAMVFGWAGGLVPWAFSNDPLTAMTIKNIIVTSLLVMVAWTHFKFEALLAIVAHAGMIFSAMLAYYGVLSLAGGKGRGFLALSYADIATGLQHGAFILIGGLGAAQNAVLGWGNRGRSMAASARVPVLQKAAGE